MNVHVVFFCQRESPVFQLFVFPYLQGALLAGGKGQATVLGNSAPVPFSYSDIAGVGVAKFLDHISTEEAASLVSQS